VRGVQIKTSAGEAAFELQLKADKVTYQREVMLVPGRKFRVDFLIGKDVVVEIEGGIWNKGFSGHSSGVGITRDCEKGNLLTALGYRLFRFPTKQAVDGTAIKFLKEHGVI
jgi:very-short-patch-repair endonuclease